jgi:hypothetical protein
VLIFCFPRRSVHHTVHHHLGRILTPLGIFYRYTVLLNKIKTLLDRSTFVQDSLLAADATEYPADGLILIITLPIFIPET